MVLHVYRGRLHWWDIASAVAAQHLALGDADAGPQILRPCPHTPDDFRGPSSADCRGRSAHLLVAGMMRDESEKEAAREAGGKKHCFKGNVSLHGGVAPGPILSPFRLLLLQGSDGVNNVLANHFQIIRADTARLRGNI